MLNWPQFPGFYDGVFGLFYLTSIFFDSSSYILLLRLSLICESIDSLPLELCLYASDINWEPLLRLLNTELPNADSYLLILKLASSGLDLKWYLFKDETDKEDPSPEPFWLRSIIFSFSLMILFFTYDATFFAHSKLCSFGLKSASKVTSFLISYINNSVSFWYGGLSSNFSVNISLKIGLRTTGIILYTS